MAETDKERLERIAREARPYQDAESAADLEFLLAHARRSVMAAAATGEAEAFADAFFRVWKDGGVSRGDANKAGLAAARLWREAQPVVVSEEMVEKALEALYPRCVHLVSERMKAVMRAALTAALAPKGGEDGR